MTVQAGSLVHEFNLLHYPCQGPTPSFDEPRYDALKAHPPTGCIPEDFGGLFGLRCSRTGPTLLDAVAEVCREINAAHGILMTDLGVEKLWEWASDGRSGFGATITGQLLLMAVERGTALGYSVEDLARFLRTVGSSTR